MNDDDDDSSINTSNSKTLVYASFQDFIPTVSFKGSLN